MGNDGGSIPKRRELVKNSARAPTVSELKATTLEALGHAWTTDPISTEPLDLENAVSDWRGRIYNYETILKGLIPSEEETNGDAESGENESGEDASKEITFASTGIRSLRDVVKLKFKRQGGVTTCPISMKELGPAVKAVYIVPCGHVFAEVAMREISEDVCPECAEAFERDNIVPLLPTDAATRDKLAKRIEGLRASGLAHSLKKDKSAGKNGKKKKRKAGDENGDVVEGEGKEKKAKVAKKDAPMINNAMTASLTAKVMEEQAAREKRRKMALAN